MMTSVTYPMLIMLCVNDCDNGLNTGMVDAVHFGDCALCTTGQPLRCYIPSPNKLRVGRRVFPFHDYRTWVGNWCWDAITVDTPVAEAIAEYLRQRGWDCEMGDERLYDAWHGNQPIRFK